MMIGDLKQAQKELEDYYEEDLAKVTSEVADMTSRDRTAYLTSKSAGYTSRMMTRWDELFRFIAVKYNDQIVKNTKDGQFIGGTKGSPGDPDTVCTSGSWTEVRSRYRQLS